MENLLSILTFTPLLAALILAIFLSGDDDAARQNAKWLGLTATGATFFVAIAIFLGFEPANAGFQFEESRPAPFGLSYRMGIDGVSLGFVLLTTAVMPIVVGLSWTLQDRVKGYIIALLSFESLLLAAFLSTDLVFFVLFFELAAIPLLLLIGYWGGKGADLHAMKAWLYMLPGTVLLVIAATNMANEAGTTDMGALLRHNFMTGEGALPGGAQGVLWLMIAASVAVKAAIWPLHAWLPGVIVKSPLPVGLLAAVLLTKLGLYGLMRFSLGMLPVAWDGFLPLVLALGGVAIVLGALAAFVSETLCKTLGYIAVAQTGMLLVTLTAGTEQGFDGATLAVVGHGLTLTGLFALAVMLEARGATRDLAAFGALKSQLPVLTGFFLLFALSLAALPGTVSFAALFFATMGTAAVSLPAAFLLALSSILFAALALALYRHLMLGPRIKESFKLVADLDGRERLILTLAFAGLLLLGLWPGVLVERTAPALAEIAAQLTAQE